ASGPVRRGMGGGAHTPIRPGCSAGYSLVLPHTLPGAESGRGERHSVRGALSLYSFLGGLLAGRWSGSACRDLGPDGHPIATLRLGLCRGGSRSRLAVRAGNGLPKFRLEGYPDALPENRRILALLSHGS